MNDQTTRWNFKQNKKILPYTNGITNNKNYRKCTSIWKLPSRYKSSTDPINPLTLPIRKYPPRELHTYRVYNTDYISQFPILFWVRFQCGSTSHFYHKEFPKENHVKSRRQFWKELWICKSHKNKKCTHPRLKKYLCIFSRTSTQIQNKPTFTKTI